MTEMREPPAEEMAAWIAEFQRAADRGGQTVVLPHECHPGWRWVPIPDGTDIGLLGIPSSGARYGIPPSPWEYPKGTVWRCDNCKRHWVSLGQVFRPGVCGWRPEFRRERRRRLGLKWWQREAR